MVRGHADSVDLYSRFFAFLYDTAMRNPSKSVPKQIILCYIFERYPAPFREYRRIASKAIFHDFPPIGLRGLPFAAGLVCTEIAQAVAAKAVFAHVRLRVVELAPAGERYSQEVKPVYRINFTRECQAAYGAWPAG